MRAWRLNAKRIGVAMIVLCGCGCETARLTHKDQIDPTMNAIPSSWTQSTAVSKLVGSKLGLGGGYLIGVAPAMAGAQDSAAAVHAARHAEEAPATLAQARNAKTADLNNDGFVTLDEILAMNRAGLSDQEILDRLKLTGYAFQLSPEQERYLTDRGITGTVTVGIHQLAAVKPPATQEARAGTAVPDRK